MTGNLTFHIDKFTFQVPTDRYYTKEGVWALVDEDLVRIGLTDFLQQRSGDVAFAEVVPEGTVLTSGDEFGVIETIKVDISLPSPISGVVVGVNPQLELEPEVINMDPYENGWLALIKPTAWESDKATFLEPNAYITAAKGIVEQEMKET